MLVILYTFFKIVNDNREYTHLGRVVFSFFCFFLEPLLAVLDLLGRLLLVQLRLRVKFLEFQMI